MTGWGTSQILIVSQEKKMLGIRKKNFIRIGITISSFKASLQIQLLFHKPFVQTSSEKFSTKILKNPKKKP